MNEIVEGIINAFKLLASGDPTIIEISLRTIYISGTATLLATAWSLPIALIMGLKHFWGRDALKDLFSAMLGVPTVGLGLILFLLFSRSGPMGFLRLLYTPTGIIIGQAMLITPIVVSFITSAVEAVDPGIKDLARTLGASEIQTSLTVLNEAKSGAVLAVVAAFNRAVAELGVALMVGGNIRGVTRVLTTTIALETSRGELALSVALAIILLLIVTVLRFAMRIFERRI